MIPSSLPSSSKPSFMQMRWELLQFNQEVAKTDSKFAGVANHHHQVPQQNRGVQEKAECWFVGVLRRQEQAVPQLYFIIQEHRDPPFGPQPRKRRKVIRNHQIQVPKPAEQHWIGRTEAGQDQPDHPREEPQSAAPDFQIDQERMIFPSRIHPPSIHWNVATLLGFISHQFDH